MDWLNQAQQFMPHGMCLAWRPGLMALHVVSDGLIAASYFAIPFVLAVFLRRRRDLDASHRALAILFVAFITLCGLTHVASIVVLWKPLYVYEGWLKAATALASVATAAFLPILVPQMLRIPSPRLLQQEMEARREALAELDAARAALALRVDRTEYELHISNRRFEAALRHSPVTVFEQDGELNYTWVYNPPLGLKPDDLVGKSEIDIFPREVAEEVQAMKRAVLDSGEGGGGEFRIETRGGSGWFDIRVEPIDLADGRGGLIATSTDVTARRDHEAHLQMLMREMNHRSKNVLAMVIAIARQTARSFAMPEGFEDRLSERLAALASAHDVLARQEWRGADLGAVLEGQLRHHLDAYGARIRVEGGACALPPEAAHYVGLALHELGSNAVKHGALAGGEGKVTIAWRVEPGEAGPELDLSWRETGAGPATEPDRSGFGSTILRLLVAQALAGRSEMVFGEDGFAWRLRAPLQSAST
ncbi:MAG: PAS domain-containing protein [Caulobacteraceae bacterium]|nr:PAS domain-containing protein [Caulobacteraceae bacterium]